jgi:hypothetical protein
MVDRTSTEPSSSVGLQLYPHSFAGRNKESLSILSKQRNFYTTIFGHLYKARLVKKQNKYMMLHVTASTGFTSMACLRPGAPHTTGEEEKIWTDAMEGES